MTDGTPPYRSLEDGATALVAQVRDLGFHSARMVVSRFSEMFDHFQTVSGAGVWAGRLGIPPLAPYGDAEVDVDRLQLPHASPGGRSTSRLWLHNATSSPTSGLRLWSPGLVAHDGRIINASAMAFRPENVARVEAHSSVEVTLTVEVPSDACPGTYHAQVLVEGVPGTAYPIAIDVIAREHQ